MIELVKFESSDCERLIRWVPDARFLLQWAGPEFTWPLDRRQIEANLRQTAGRHPTRYIFKARETASGKVVGHIELARVDYQHKTAHIARVLVGPPALRGKGYGGQLVAAVVDFAFEKLDLETLTLNVFDFNEAALACYRSLGFERDGAASEKSRSWEGQTWRLLLMRLRRHAWRRRPQTNQGVADPP
jgi:RimJ/RimL family protein N-acetyltransferase